MDLQIFRKYYNPVEANIIFNKLQSNGIHCFLTNEHTSTMLWHLSIAHGGVNVIMDSKDFEKAELILQNDPAPIEDVEYTKTRCPQCGSNNIKFGSQSEVGINWFQLIFGLLMAGPAPVLKKAYHCFNCGNNFETGDVKID